MSNKEGIESIEEVTYSLHPHITAREVPEPIPYSEMKEVMRSTQVYADIRDNGVDTPVQYFYKNRMGFIRGQVFMNYCIPREMSMIRAGNKKSYIVHPDQAETAVRVERQIFEEKGFKGKVTYKKVLVSQFQIELNIEENFIW